MQDILIITGPTASGKKKIALECAEKLGGEIVSADSRKVYRYLDIISAKPTADERARAPHHLIDIIKPDEPFSAGEWVRRASEAARDIVKRGALPIISGGAGFYISALIEGLTEGFDSDPAIRARLESELSEFGADALYTKLREHDPQRAAELSLNDTFRVIRALEVIEITGRPFSDWRGEPRLVGADEFEYHIYGIDMARDRLYERINRRADKMAEMGLLDEVRGLLEMGYDPSLVALDTVGFKEWLPFLDGNAGFDECLDTMKRNTRRYAKRQLTWFRNRFEDIIHWAEHTPDDEGASTAGEIMRDFTR